MVDKNGTPLNYRDLVHVDTPLYGELYAVINALTAVDDITVLAATVKIGNSVFPAGTGVLLFGSDVTRLGIYDHDGHKNNRLRQRLVVV